MMDTIRVMSLDQKSRFLMLGPCSSGGNSPFFAWKEQETQGVQGLHEKGLTSWQLANSSGQQHQPSPVT